MKRMALVGIDVMQLFAGRGKEKEMNLRRLATVFWWEVKRHDLHKYNYLYVISSQFRPILVVGLALIYKCMSCCQLYSCQLCL